MSHPDYTSLLNIMRPEPPHIDERYLAMFAAGALAVKPVAPTFYDKTLTDTADDGTNTSGFTWSTSTCIVNDLDGNGTGRDDGDQLPGWSFPNVGFTTCSSAWLVLTVVTETTPGTFKIRGQDNSLAASNQWNVPSGAAHTPVNATAVAAEKTGITTAVGQKFLDVTTMVQQIMAGAAYAGGRINFWGEASSASAKASFGHVGSGTAARLIIVPTGYDLTLLDTLDDGVEEVSTSWTTAGNIFIDDRDIDGSGENPTDAVGTWSFPGVNLMTCSNAILTLNTIVLVIPGTYQVKGQSQALAASQRWSATNLPIADGAVAVAGTVTGLVIALGAVNIDVTTIVKNIMLGAFWASGNRINFWASITSGLGAGFTVAGVAGSSSAPARLRITP